MHLTKAHQDLKFVEYPEVKQTHLFLMNGTVYSYLQYQSIKKRAAFVSSAIMMNKWTPSEWFRYSQLLEISATINCVFVFPYYCQYRDSFGPYEIFCDDPEVNSDANLPIKYKSMIGSFSLLITQYLLKSSLPNEATNIINSCENNGYQVFCQIHSRLHPKLMCYPIDVCYATPRQGTNDSAHLYLCQVYWHHRILAYILNYVTDNNKEYVQDRYAHCQHVLCV